jgi:S1-C subfamily serine protease
MDIMDELVKYFDDTEGEWWKEDYSENLYEDEEQLSDLVVKIESNILGEMLVLEGDLKIEKHTGIGTGFLFSVDSSNPKVLTAAHVAPLDSTSNFRFSGSSEEEALIEVERDDKRDLLLFMTGLDADDYSDFNLIFGDSDEVSRGDDVFVLGYPVASSNINKREGEVTGIERNLYIEGNLFLKLIIADTKVEGGFSGSPLVNSDNKIMGVVLGGTEDGDAVVLPINEVKEAFPDYFSQS